MFQHNFAFIHHILVSTAFEEGKCLMYIQNLFNTSKKIINNKYNILMI